MGKDNGNTLHKETSRHIHRHGPDEKRMLLNRLSRAIGHLEHVKKMVEKDYDCNDVLIQLAAVRAAVNNTGKVILKSHLEHCIFEAAREGDEKALKDMGEAIERFIN